MGWSDLVYFRGRIKNNKESIRQVSNDDLVILFFNLIFWPTRDKLFLAHDIRSSFICLIIALRVFSGVPNRNVMVKQFADVFNAFEIHKTLVQPFPFISIKSSLHVVSFCFVLFIFLLPQQTTLMDRMMFKTMPLWDWLIQHFNAFWVAVHRKF